MQVNKLKNGSIEIFGTHGGIFYNEQFFFYSRKEAIKKFREKFNLKNKKLNIKGA